jgi:hypothetical protein
MFSDPQSITINAVAKSMPRIESAGTSSRYSMDDETFKLSISHSKQSGDRVRSVVRVDQRAVVPDPLTSVNDYENLGVYLVIDRPTVGFTSTQVDYVVQGLKTWLSSGSVVKMFGQES